MKSGPSPFRFLGVLWLVYGCMRVIAAAAFVIYGSTLALMWGSLLTRVPDPNGLMILFDVLLVLAVTWCIVSAFFAFFAGNALLKGSSVAQTEVQAATMLALPDLPLGVILGVYTAILASPRASFTVERSQPSPPTVMPLRRHGSL